jgi:mRNA-degrading endonuclease toxin of MazEF toxin-antitoxin module
MIAGSRPCRGDIWRVAFGRPVGHAQAAGVRPGLVLSTDQFHDTGAGIVIVAPLTTIRRDYPWRVRVPGSGLRQQSWAAVEHLRSLSTLRLLELLGTVEDVVLLEVESVLDLLLHDRG